MWPNPQESTDLVTFTEEILMEYFISYAMLLALNCLLATFTKKLHYKYFTRSWQRSCLPLPVRFIFIKSSPNVSIL